MVSFFTSSLHRRHLQRNDWISKSRSLSKLDPYFTIKADHIFSLGVIILLQIGAGPGPEILDHHFCGPIDSVLMPAHASRRVSSISTFKQECMYKDSRWGQFSRMTISPSLVSSWPKSWSVRSSVIVAIPRASPLSEQPLISLWRSPSLFSLKCFSWGHDLPTATKTTFVHTSQQRESSSSSKRGNFFMASANPLLPTSGQEMSWRLFREGLLQKQN